MVGSTHGKSISLFNELDTVENDGTNVVSILFGKSLIWMSINLSDKFGGVFNDFISDFGAKGFGMLVSSVLRE